MYLKRKPVVNVKIHSRAPFKVKRSLFFLLLSIITVLGLLLRLVDYDKVPPPNETFDELIYAWGGATLITSGTPSSWSNVEPYEGYRPFERFDVRFKIVSPMIEKPPFYFILSGLTVLAFGQGDPFYVGHEVIRLLPLVLSIFTILLTGLLAEKVFGRGPALIAALLYATVPSIVLANRLSLTENFLTPLVLLTFVLIPRKFTKARREIITAGALSTIAILTKQAGVSLGASLMLLFALIGRRTHFIIIGLFTTFGVFSFFAYGAYYDLGLFLDLQKTWRISHALSGVPEFIASIFRFPTIGPKEHAFLDGSILFGYLLLFSAPMWLFKDSVRDFRRLLLIVFPFCYLILVSISASASAQYTFWGWYLYPIFPFMMIFLGYFFWSIYKENDIFKLLLAFLIIGASTVRFIYINVPRELLYTWQYVFILIFLMVFFVWLLGARKTVLMFFLFVVFVGVNIYVDINLDKIYPF